MLQRIIDAFLKKNFTSKVAIRTSEGPVVILGQTIPQGRLEEIVKASHDSFTSAGIELKDVFPIEEAVAENLEVQPEATAEVEKVVEEVAAEADPAAADPAKPAETSATDPADGDGGPAAA